MQEKSAYEGGYYRDIQDLGGLARATQWWLDQLTPESTRPDVADSSSGEIVSSEIRCATSERVCRISLGWRMRSFHLQLFQGPVEAMGGRTTHFLELFQPMLLWLGNASPLTIGLSHAFVHPTLEVFTELHGLSPETFWMFYLQGHSRALSRGQDVYDLLEQASTRPVLCRLQPVRGIDGLRFCDVSRMPSNGYLPFVKTTRDSSDGERIYEVWRPSEYRRKSELLGRGRLSEALDALVTALERHD